MRNVVLYQLLSLDGVAEEPSDWMVKADEALFENLGRVIGAQDAVLLGRGTYDYWVGYWPSSDNQPFADFINGTQKHVFTSTTPPETWSESSFVDAPAGAYVAELKRQPGGDIGIHGSISLAQSLLEAELIDELRLVISPTVAGRGRRLFAGGDLHRFELLDLGRTTTGAIIAGYARR